MSTLTAPHLEARWSRLTSTRTATHTLATWAAADPVLTDACRSWPGLLAEIRTHEATPANRLVRYAQTGDELAHLTLLVAVAPRLGHLVRSRRGLWSGDAVEMGAEAVSLASLEFLRPTLARREDRVLFRVISNVDWTLFRQHALRCRIAPIIPLDPQALDAITRSSTLTGRTSTVEIAASEHVELLLDHAVATGFPPVDAELVRRRVVFDDHTPPAGVAPRTHRCHTQTAIARFTAWTRHAANQPTISALAA